jgi:hypothetical protein
MKMSRMTRCVAAWIAGFAILLASFAPVLVHALPSGHDQLDSIGAINGAICSSAKSQMMSTADVGQPASPEAPSPAAHHLDHCPYCYTHGGQAHLPAGDFFTLPVLTATLSHPALFYQSPRPLFTWASAHSRAPPSRS